MNTIRTAGCVALIIFVLSLFGILTRPIGLLAAVWPANAVLIGLFVIRPSWAGPVGWASAIVGFLAAGHVTGDALPINLWLTTANLAGVAAGYGYLIRLDERDRMLLRPLSLLHLCIAVGLSSFAAAAVGCGISEIALHRSIWTGFGLWMTTEFTNSAIVLPVLLTAPPLSAWLRAGRAFDWPRRIDFQDVLPLAALALLIGIALMVGGPGAIAFPSPALLWCAMRFRMFPMSMVVMCFSLAMMIFDSAGLFASASGMDPVSDSISFRIGVALMAFGPLAAASIAAAQKDLVSRLDWAVSRDALTHTLARRAFFDRSCSVLAEATERPGQGIAVLMIDIDHFKQFNDRHGHATGDSVLVAVSEAIGRGLRATDVFGRVGGEEFAVTLSRVGLSEAAGLAERVRQAVEQLPIVIDGRPELAATISIGVAHRSHPGTEVFAELLSEADAALYLAKREGRNRVAMATPRPPSAAAEGTGKGGAIPLGISERGYT